MRCSPIRSDYSAYREIFPLNELSAASKKATYGSWPKSACLNSVVIGAVYGAERLDLTALPKWRASKAASKNIGPAMVLSTLFQPSVCLVIWSTSVSYTHLRAHETDSYLVCRLLLEKKKTL